MPHLRLVSEFPTIDHPPAPEYIILLYGWQIAFAMMGLMTTAVVIGALSAWAIWA
jgi:hypothetical protein